jgi:hypothetical protein
VIIGPQHPGAVFPRIVPPAVKGPSIGSAGSKIPLVNSETITVRLALPLPSEGFMILFLCLDSMVPIGASHLVCQSPSQIVDHQSAIGFRFQKAGV